jgi:hypothetical protein
MSLSDCVIPNIDGIWTFMDHARRRRQRRREMLLTFSPGEWIWVVMTLSFYAAIWAAYR